MTSHDDSIPVTCINCTSLSRDLTCSEAAIKRKVQGTTSNIISKPQRNPEPGYKDQSALKPIIQILFIEYDVVKTLNIFWIVKIELICPVPHLPRPVKTFSKT